MGGAWVVTCVFWVIQYSFEGGLEGDGDGFGSAGGGVERQGEVVADAIVSVALVGGVGVADEHFGALVLAAAHGARVEQADAVGECAILFWNGQFGRGCCVIWGGWVIYRASVCRVACHWEPWETPATRP